MIIKKHNHDHFWIEDGTLYETYQTIRGLRYNAIMNIEEADTEECTEEQIQSLNKKYFPQEVCTHEFVSKEYSSQPYGTCMGCGKFIQN